MLFPLLFLLVTAPSADPIDRAIEKFATVSTYRVTLRSKTGATTAIISYYYKRPGFVRMEFISPHKGAILVYDPVKKTARLHPFGLLKPFVLALDPDNPLIKTKQGHTVDASDFGAFLAAVKKLRENGTESVRDDLLGERAVLLVRVEGNAGFSVGGIHSYLVWLDKNSFLPVKSAAYDMNGGLVEEALMDDIEINTELPPSLFTP